MPAKFIFEFASDCRQHPPPVLRGGTAFCRPSLWVGGTPPLPNAGIGMKRTHHCNELRPEHAGQTVTLTGWVNSRRDLGGLIFIDVRDREGRTQTVFDPSDLAKELFEKAAALRSECVVQITGKVRARPAGTNNSKIETGEIEVVAAELELLNFAEVLP